MNSSFNKISKQVANDFLQSIVFIDDKAYTKDKSRNEFNALEVSQSFAKSGKICAVYKPETEEDIDTLASLAKKSDITVIDWQIRFEPDASLPDQELLDENEDVDLNADADVDVEDDDPRGPHTRKIIREILSDSIAGKESLKLILVYTGETDLYSVADEIHKDLIANGVINIQKDGCEVFTDNVKISVIAKPSSDDGEEKKFKHNPDLNKRIITYEKLPEFILDEFTRMTSGLVSNMALTAMSSIRKNNYRILRLYNKHLDAAFLAHRGMLPVPDDAGELLKESMLNSFSAILDYNQVDEMCSYPHIKNWIQHHKFADKTLNINKKDLKLTSKELQTWQKKGFHNAIDEIWAVQFPEKTLSAEQIESKYRNIHENWDGYFVPTIATGSSHEQFSILTHHKSNFASPSYVPKLSLGSLIKGKKDGSYWLCIQQKCDSVRIASNESRRFLFLPLYEVSGNKHFNFLFESEGSFVKLKIDFGSHKLKTIKFKGQKDGTVIARKYSKSNNYFFHPIYFNSKSNHAIDQNYIWILDLKDSHAQRVANQYASQLSRVGLDESEWLRRWSS